MHTITLRSDVMKPLGLDSRRSCDEGKHCERLCTLPSTPAHVHWLAVSGIRDPSTAFGLDNHYEQECDCSQVTGISETY